ncbi:MAG: RNA polymerase sigma factor [Polyangiaceae bacterium]|nr:RNA polymerase sigma factor [Polyangiaceae bacterium]
MGRQPPGLMLPGCQVSSLAGEPLASSLLATGEEDQFGACSKVPMTPRQSFWADFGRSRPMPLRSGTDGEPKGLSSEALMERYAAGDEGAFDLLHARFAQQLFGYLLRLSGKRDRAEDLVQTTFEKVHRSRRSHVTGSLVAPWLFAIARHSFYDEERRRRARPEVLTTEGALPEPCKLEATPAAERVALLCQALARLPSTHREAFLLTKWLGHSAAEAAGSLGMTPTNLRTRVHRATHTLREFGLAGL